MLLIGDATYLENMREQLIQGLNESKYIQALVPKPGFLVFLMGPYKSYPPYETPSDHEVAEAATTRPTLDEINDRIEADEDFNPGLDDALALLIYLKDDLRERVGVNAFLATDPDIDTDELDAATQSLAYSRAADATVFVCPAMGDNLGVGIETGAVCESLPPGKLFEAVLFTQERNVESEMINAVGNRWSVTVDGFGEYAGLFQAVKAHLRVIAELDNSDTTY